MCKIFGAFLVSLFLAQFAASQVNEAQDGKPIIAKAIEAVGGEAKLARFNACSWTQTYFVFGAESPDVTRHYVQWPNRFRGEYGAEIEVADGDKYWTQNRIRTRELPKEEIPWDALRATFMCTLVPLLEKEFTFKRLGETRIGARKADGVLVLRKGYPTVKLYFDTETSLLVKSEFQIKERVPPFKDVPCEFYFSDYREVKGVKFPHKRVAKHGPEVWDIMEISNLKSIDVVDPKLFEKPGK